MLEAAETFLFYRNKKMLPETFPYVKTGPFCLKGRKVKKNVTVARVVPKKCVLYYKRVSGCSQPGQVCKPDVAGWGEYLCSNCVWKRAAGRS